MTPRRKAIEYKSNNLADFDTSRVKITARCIFDPQPARLLFYLRGTYTEGIFHTEFRLRYREQLRL